MPRKKRISLKFAGRGILVAFILLSLSVILSGCGQSDSPTPTPSLPATSVPDPVLQTGPTPVVLSLVYQDDFSDQSSGWDDAFDEQTLKQYGAHQYHIEVNAPNLFAWGLANRDIADFVLEVMTKEWEGPANNSYGIIFRLQDKDNFYRFDITGDGFFLLSKFVDAKWLTLVDWTASPFINSGQAENELRVSALGSKISVYANGHLLAEVEDQSFRHGDIGFFAGTFDEEGVHISFDELRVWAPPGSEIAFRMTATPTATRIQPADTPTTAGEPEATSTVEMPAQPTMTSVAIAQGQPTATPTSGATATKFPSRVPVPTPSGGQPTATKVLTQTTSGGTSALIPEDLPSYVSAIQPRPKEAHELFGTIVYPVFDSERGTYDIYLIDVATGENEKVQEDASQPSLSSDGEQIAFRSWDKVTQGLVYRALSSTNFEMIIKQEEAAHPAWGPSDEVFYFHSRKDADRAPRLYRADGSTREPLTYAGETLRGESPALLGQNDLVYKGCLGNNCGIMRIDLNEGTPQLLTDELSDTAPAGAPNGERIAFMSQRSGNWDIYTINKDGTDLKNITPGASNDGLPTWSPDGRSIAFLSDRNGSWGLWVMDDDGSNQYQLLQLNGSPDGKVRSVQDFMSVGWTEEQLSWGP